MFSLRKAMIRPLEVTDTIDAIRADLEHTRTRLSRDAITQDLEPRAAALIAAVDVLVAVPVPATPSAQASAPAPLPVPAGLPQSVGASAGVAPPQATPAQPVGAPPTDVPPPTALAARTAAPSETADQAQAATPPQLAAILAFIAAANTERATLLGELAVRACLHRKVISWTLSFFTSTAHGGGQTAPAPAQFRRSGPATANDWTTVANERAQDARAILLARPPSIGSVYLAGYSVECSLKAVLKARNRPFATAGASGHDLRGLWEAAGFRLSDLSDTNGAKAFFLQHWSTDLRYESKTQDIGIGAQDLLAAAGAISGWLQTRARREKNNR